MRVFLGLASLLLAGCSDGLTGMRLTDGSALRLDWTFNGGVDKRADRLLLSDDGVARRNGSGNLSTLVMLDAGDRETLEALRVRHAAIDVERHTGPRVAYPSAHRLRFDGLGTEPGEEQVRAFAEALLLRLAHQAVLARSAVVVAATTSPGLDGSSTLHVEQVLQAGDATDGGPPLSPGDRIDANVRDACAGACRELTVFTFATPPARAGSGRWQASDAGYLKLDPQAAAAALARAAQ